MNPATQTATLASPSSAQACVAPDNSKPLTRVSLAYVEQRINLYLRFGQPVRTVQLDRWRRCAVFLPAAIFCRIYWQANDYGTTRWQLIVLQACRPLEAMQRIPGVRPGARLLLHAEGEQKVRSVLAQLDTIEALDIDPADVSPAYWCTLGNRLAAHRPLPHYTAERHAAWLAGRMLQ